MPSQLPENIEDIISCTQCPNNCRCAATEPEHPGKARRLGFEHYLECLGDEPWSCPLAVFVDGGYFCDCATRVFLEAKLAK